jgi:hypothetical protein
MRSCGKRFRTEETARHSKRGLQPDAVVKGCRYGCGGFHVELPGEPPKPRSTRSPGKHRKRLKPVSDKRQAENRERRKMADEVFGPAPECGIRWDAGCRGLADDLHETLSRARSGGDITNPDICLPACRPCHSKVDDFPAEAERRGFLLPSGRPRKAVPR